MLPEPGESWRIQLETGNSQPATGRPTYTEKHMSNAKDLVVADVYSAQEAFKASNGGGLVRWLRDG